MQIWFDNALVDAESVGVSDDGWPDGHGIFETIKTEGGQVYELGRHMRRALAASANLKIALPSEDLIREAITKLMAQEKFAVGRLRLLFSESRFIAVHQLYEEVKSAAKLQVMSSTGAIEASTNKTFPYTTRLALLAHARSEGFDEIVGINTRDEVTEGAVSNFIFRLDGRWVTTPLTAGVLPGIQRGIAIERCGVTVKLLTRSDLLRVDAAFVLSSLKIALSVSEIDGRAMSIDGDCAALEAQIRAKTLKHSVG